MSNTSNNYSVTTSKDGKQSTVKLPGCSSQDAKDIANLMFKNADTSEAVRNNPNGTHTLIGRFGRNSST